jgi:hypothetical protein
VNWRQVVHLALPVERGLTRRFRLRARGGGFPTARDWPILSFRCYSYGWSDESERIRALPPTRRVFNFLAVNSSGSCGTLYRLARWGYRHLRWGGRVLRRLFASGRNLLLGTSADVPPAYIHCNACGDFTLMAREHWFDLRGHPELEIFSLNIDAVFCYMAHHGGAEETMLDGPMRIYHIEHSVGSGATPEGVSKLLEKINNKGIPVLAYDEVIAWAARMRAENRPLLFNREDWGLAHHELPETVPCAVARAA